MDRSSKLFKFITQGILCLLSVTVLLPIILMIVSSLTNEKTLVTQGYSFITSNISFDAYKFLFGGGSSTIFGAYEITLIVSVMGTSLGLLLTIMLGYALSVPGLPFKRVIAFYVFFTMLFNGSLVPTYMMYNNVFHIKNTIWALVIPSLLVNAFWVILARSFFTSTIPQEVIEAARIDGAGEIGIFVRIVMPMSATILATIGLMIFLAYWNNWTNGLYYITDRNLYSIQQLLQMMVRNMQGILSSAAGSQGVDVSKLPGMTIQMAMAVVGILPIMIIYPIFQQYFVKGVTLGAVKG